MTEDRGFEKEEESSLKGTDYELLVVIANQGYTDVIMDAARKANATGGTVIHAKGTGMEKAGKVFRRFPCSGERDDLYGHKDKG